MDAGNPRGALAAALSAWRASRDPSLASIVEWLSARTELGAPITDQQKWLKLADAQDDEALPNLLATLTEPKLREAEERAQQLIGWEDPRISTALLAVLASPRYRASGARWFYERLFKALAAQRDPRVAPALEELGARYHLVVTNTYGVELQKLICAFAPTVRTAARPATKEEAQAIARLQTHFESERADHRRATQQAESSRDAEAALLQQIARAPEDDGLRQVWADLLVERGDPRGELINFQLMEKQGGLSAEQLAQLRLVQSRHRDRLLGGIAACVDNAVFDRGVAVHVQLGRGWESSVAPTAAEWQLVRGVTLPADPWRAQERAAFLAKLPRLDTVMLAEPELLQRLARPLAHALLDPEQQVEGVLTAHHLLGRGLAAAPVLRTHAGQRVTLESTEPDAAVEALRASRAPSVRWVEAVHLLDPHGFYGWSLELHEGALDVRGRFSDAPAWDRLWPWLTALRRLGPRKVTVHTAVERDVLYLPLLPLHLDATLLERAEAAIGVRPTQS